MPLDLIMPELLALGVRRGSAVPGEAGRAGGEASGTAWAEEAAEPAGDEAGLAGGGRGRSGPRDSANPEASAMAVCLRLLTAAPRTRVQLEQALQRREVPPEIIEVVLDRLVQARVIDDAMFAQMWVESRHYGRGLAKRALTAELRQRGVGEDDLREAVDELSTEQEEAAARRMVAAKLPSSRGRPLPTRVRRLMSLLARKGYSPGLAYRVVREALEQEKADWGEDPAGDEAGMDLEAVLDAGQALEEEQEADGDTAAFGPGDDDGAPAGGPDVVII